MNKQELIDSISEKASVPKATASKVLEALMSSIEDELKNPGKFVSLVGWGSFTVAERAAREGRNPSTGAPIKIPASKVVRFKPGKALKDAVKEVSSSDDN